MGKVQQFPVAAVASPASTVMVWVAEQPGWGGLLDIWIKFLSVKVSVPLPVLMTQPENIQPKNTIIQGCNPHEAAN